MRFPKIVYLSALVAIGLGGPAVAAQPPASPQDGQLPGFLQVAPSQFIVRFRGNAAQRSGRTHQQILDSAAASLLARGAPVMLGVSRTLALGPELVKSSRLLTDTEAEVLLAALSQDTDVLYAEVDGFMQLASNDPIWSQQWWMHGQFGVNVAPAWSVMRGHGLVVAVLDSGTLPDPDIDEKRHSGYDFIAEHPFDDARDGDGRDPDPVASDGCAHGLKVESTIAAAAGNAIGMAGVAPDAEVLPVRVISCEGGQSSDIAEAILWASGAPVPGTPLNLNPAEIINLSLSGDAFDGCPRYFQDAIDVAASRGATIVAAAGNDHGVDVARRAPANCNHVIAVGATDANGDIATFSNGPAGVDLWAPGANMLLPNGWGGFYPANGTSFSTPIVAGAIALLQGQRVRTPAEAEAALKHSARVAPWGGRLIDVGAAIAMQQGSKNLPYVPLQFALDGDGLACMQSAGLGQQPTRSQCLPAGGAQTWAVDGASNVGYTFRGRAANSGCLATNGGSTVVESPCDNGRTQRWDAIITSHASGRYVGRLRNRATGQCLTFSENRAVEQSCNDAQTVWVMLEHAQRIPQQTGNWFHGLQAATGGVCVGHDGNVVSLHNACSRYNRTGDYQRTGFRLHPLDQWSDAFRITGANANQCMTVVQLADGWNVAMRACNGGDRWQQWSLVATDTHWQLRNVGNGQCLTPKGGGMATGTPMVVASCASTSDNMRWRVAGLRI